MLWVFRIRDGADPAPFLRKGAGQAPLILRCFMKKFLIATFIFILPAMVTGDEWSNWKPRGVSDIKKANRKNHARVLRQVKGFMKEVNLGISGASKVRLSSPMKPESIRGMVEIRGLHSGGVIVPKIYGFVNTGSLNMRSLGSTSGKILGKLKFREEVEILLQSDRTEKLGGHNAPWLLVKRKNGDEGWVYGYFVSDTMPEKKDSGGDKTNWKMKVPTKGFISSKYGYRVDPITKRRGSFHKGIDIAAPKGNPVYAAAAGTVYLAKYVRYGYGNLIIIKHGESLSTYYGHLSKILVKKGQKVTRGALIGKVGSTGRSTGPHLHFEVRKGKKTLDPSVFWR